MQDRKERNNDNNNNKILLVGSMARGELWRTEKDNSIYEVVCYGQEDFTCKTENL